MSREHQRRGHREVIRRIEPVLLVAVDRRRLHLHLLRHQQVVDLAAFRRAREAVIRLKDVE